MIKQIAEEFNRNGFQLYEVGGAVRDSLLKRQSKDIDLTTDACPEKIKEILNKFGSIYTLGERFGTIGMKYNSSTIEITTFRKEDYSSESRKPAVTFGDNLEGDLTRRDFTINAIARNPITGETIDLFGGVNDLNNRVIRCVGNPTERFDEDPLRMLRAIRLACELNFMLDVKIDHPERIKIVSKERIRDEFIKIMLSPKPAFGVRKMCQTGLMNYIIPEFTNLKNIEQGKNHIKDAYEHSILVLLKGSKINHKDNLVFRLACMLHDIGKPDTKIEDDDGVHFYGHHSVGARKARTLLYRLRFERDIIESVSHLIKYHMTPIMLQREIVNGKIKKRVIMRLVRKVGVDNIYLLMDLVKCDIRSSKNPRYKFMTILTKIVNECMKEKPETLESPIDGHEIMKEFELKPGMFVGEVKTHLTNLVIDGKLGKDDRSGAFAEARKYIYTKREKVA